MDVTPKIPIVTQQNAAVESDVNTGHLAIAAAERHPVDRMQRSSNANGNINPYQNLQFIRSVYGSALAMEMAAERQMVHKEHAMGMHRIGGLTQDLVLGTDAQLQVTDFMSLPDHRSELPKSVFHPAMARQLKNL
jgi:Proteasome maturation factor UMP1